MLKWSTEKLGVKEAVEVSSDCWQWLILDAAEMYFVLICSGLLIAWLPPFKKISLYAHSTQWQHFSGEEKLP